MLKQLPFGSLTIQENGDVVARSAQTKAICACNGKYQGCTSLSTLITWRHVGAGEAFMDGLWDSDDVTAVVRVFARNLSTLDEWENKFKWVTMPINKIQHFARRNTRTKPRKISRRITIWVISFIPASLTQQ